MVVVERKGRASFFFGHYFCRLVKRKEAFVFLHLPFARLSRRARSTRRARPALLR